jgi:NAD(P)H-dependent flavin oxidoreductase YrpB (nitropropane dioxygenase family)
MSLDQLSAAIAQVRSASSNPFGVNLLPEMPDLRERIKLVGESGAGVASFAGPPSVQTVEHVHDAGLLAIVTVGAPRHAEKMVGLGVDALIAQGGEGGGHTGSIPTSLLLPQVVTVVDGRVPVLGAGGFHSGQGLVAALAWGADGIAMGTRFLLTSDSRVPDEVKQRYVATGLNETVVTAAIDGKPQRLIVTPFVKSLQRAYLTRFPRAASAAWRFRRSTGASVGEFVHQGLEMRANQGLTWSQLALAANAPMMTRTALVEGDLSAGILPAGQVVGLIESLPSVAELLTQIRADAEETLSRLHSMASRN